MKKFILGKKIGMTQLVSQEGQVVPVTVVQAGPCSVVELRNKEKNGYNAVLLGYGNAKNITKPQEGFFKSKNQTVKRYLKEFRVDDVNGYELAQEIKVDQFEENEIVKVKSKTIGRGFSGTIRRHGFGRGPMTHGSKSHRIPGSIGAGTDPSHVFKGKRMSGHYGDEFVTISNLKVVRVDLERNLVFIKGAVPGKKNNLVEIFN